jgi:hypothetical protein
MRNPFKHEEARRESCEAFLQRQRERYKTLFGSLKTVRKSGFKSALRESKGGKNVGRI